MPRRLAPSKEQSLQLPGYRELPATSIAVPATASQWAGVHAELRAATVLGFDTESKPVFSSTQVDTGPHVIQFATIDRAWILQMHHPEALPLAREIIAATHILKVGFGLDNDRQSLRRSLGIEPEQLMDLDRRFSRHGFGANVGVRAAVALVLGESFHKSKKTSTSNWSLPRLSPAQVRYAANDAHAPARVWQALSQWEAAQPPLPVRRARRAR